MIETFARIALLQDLARHERVACAFATAATRDATERRVRILVRDMRALYATLTLDELREFGEYRARR